MDAASRGPGVEKINVKWGEVRDVARHNGHAPLECRGCDQYVALRARVRHVQRGGAASDGEIDRQQPIFEHRQQVVSLLNSRALSSAMAPLRVGTVPT